MNEATLSFGIPDIDLPRHGGGTVNPGDFAGHPLIVVFCPTDPAAVARELRHLVLIAIVRYPGPVSFHGRWSLSGST